MTPVLASRRALLVSATGFALISATGLRAQPSAVLPNSTTKVIKVTKTGSLRDMADKAGYDGNAPANIAFVVPAKLVIMGKPGTNPGLDTGKWPQGSHLWLTVDGHVYGGGGSGSSGGDIPGAKDGGKGGDALYVQAPITIVVTAKGSVKGGGGGGSGANGGSVGGSGGGGGFPNGIPGEAGSPVGTSDTGFGGFSERGKYGTPAGGGQGGAKGNPGGAGGNAGMPGESAGRSGGAPGNAIQKNGNEVAILNYGQIYGEVF